MHFFIHRFLLVLTVILLSGCGGGGGGGGAQSAVGGDTGSLNPPGFTPAPTGTLRLQLPLERAVPAEVQNLRLSFFDLQGRLVLGPMSRPKAPLIEIFDVPVTAVTVQIDFLVASRVAASGSRGIVMTAGQTTIIDAFEFTETTSVLERITLSPGAPTVPLGGEQTFTARGHFQDGEQRDLTSLVEWSVEDPSVATLLSPGTVKASAIGTTSLRASFGGVEGQVSLTVSAAVATRLVAEPPMLNLSKGLNGSVSVSALYSDGTVRSVDQEVEWSSEDARVATWNDRVYASGVGQTRLVARFGNLQVPVVVSVGEAQPVALRVEPARLSVAKGLQSEIRAIATFTDSSQRDVSSSVEWRSEDDGIAFFQSSGVFQAWAVGATAIEARLGDLRATSELTVTAAELSSIELAPPSGTFPQDRSFLFAAYGTYTDGTRVDISPLVSWDTTDQTIATVSPSGIVTTRSGGLVRVRAHLGAVSGELEIYVQALELVELVISTPTMPIPNGVGAELEVVALYNNGAVIEVTEDVTWESEAAEIAYVELSGALRTRGEGSTTISAHYGGRTATLLVSVGNARLASLRVVPAEQSLAAGTSTGLKAIGTFTDGSQREVTSVASWFSEDAEVASVGQGGGVVTYRAGETTLRASLDGVFSPWAALKVTPAELSSLQVTPADEVLADGTMQQYTVIGTFTDGTRQDLTTEVHWSVGDESVARIGLQGLLTALDPGTTSVTVKSGLVSGHTRLTVSEASPMSLSLSPSSLSLAKGLEQSLALHVTLTDNTRQEVTNQAFWRSSDASVVQVDQAGKVRGLAVGTAEVIAQYGGLDAVSILVVVTDAELVSLEIDPDGATVVDGLFRQYAASGHYTDGSVQEVTSSVTWQTSDLSIATIDLEGRVQGLSEGVVEVSATLEGISATVSLQVTAAEVLELRLEPVALSLPKGLTRRLTAHALLTDQREVEVSDGVIWGVADSSIASLSLDGVIRGEVVGETQVSATLGSLTVSTSVTVGDPVLVGIDLSPTDFVLGQGAFFYYKAYARSSDGEVAEVTDSASWTVSDDSLATIATDGKLTALATGEARVNATYQGLQGSSRLRVVPADIMPGDAILNLTRLGDQTLPSLDSRMHLSRMVWDSEEEGRHHVRVGIVNSRVEVKVSQEPSRDLTYPDIAVDPSGGSLVVWEATSEEGHGIFYRLFDIYQRPLTDMRQACQLSDERPSRPRVASVGDGFVLVWEQPDGLVGSTLGGAFISADGLLVRNDLVFSTGLDGRHRRPQISSGRDGKYSVCWENDSAGDWDVVLRSFDSNGPTTLISRVNTSLEGDQTEPSIARNENGFVAISWTHEGSDGSQRVRYRHYHPTDGPGQEQAVSGPTDGPQTNSSITLGPSGVPPTADQPLFAYQTVDSSGAGVWSSRRTFHPGVISNWLNLTQEGDQTRPSISSHFNGGSDAVAFVFEGHDGDGRGILARAYPVGYSVVILVPPR